MIEESGFYEVWCYIFIYIYIYMKEMTTPLQYSCLENSMGQGAWWVAVQGVARSQTWLKQWNTAHTHTHTYGLPWWLSSKESSCQCKRCGFNLWVKNIPVFLNGKSYRQRSQFIGSWRVGYHLTTKQRQSIHTHTHTHTRGNTKNISISCNWISDIKITIHIKQIILVHFQILQNIRKRCY